LEIPARGHAAGLYRWWHIILRGILDKADFIRTTYVSCALSEHF